MGAAPPQRAAVLKVVLLMVVARAWFLRRCPWAATFQLSTSLRQRKRRKR